jgi:predicted nuclease with RNAse H fold
MTAVKKHRKGTENEMTLRLTIAIAIIPVIETHPITSTDGVAAIGSHGKTVIAIFTP